MVFPFAQTPPAFEFRVEPNQGLTVVTGGVPIVRGSYVQVVSPDWRRSYYSSNGGGQQVEQVDGDTVRVTFKGANLDGKQTYFRNGNRLKVRTELNYSGDGSAIAEIASGFVWIPAFARRSTPAPPPTETIGGRRLGPDAPTFGIDGPLGKLEGRASVALTLFDARRYPQSWAEDKESIWVGDLSLPIEKGTNTFEIEWKVPTVATTTAPPLKRSLEAKRAADARLPDESLPMLIPKPESNGLNFDKPLEISGNWRLPIGPFDHYDDFKAALARRFALPPVSPKSKTKAVNLDGGISKLGLTPGGYRILIRADRGVSVLGEEDAGLRNAVEKLAQLAFAKNGKLYLPTGQLVDQPKSPWRGVHLFGGPQARTFHKALWSRVLRPLGLDHVVLQCERTVWDATPGIATSQTMTKAQLAELMGLYRNLGVEVVPLIQSFGHMEWLFANGKNLDLAMNPDVPYAVDPRNPRTKEVLTKIWEEAVALSRPKAMHFGLDEVNMRGWPGDDKLLTETWKTQLAFLGNLARKNGAAPMLWGDQALYGPEAPDAAFASSLEDAELRRAAIPVGSWVTDWHYKADARPEAFAPVLQLWRDAGQRPIAAGWYRPENVYGFAVAAADLGAGYLQTTWAGYTSTEQAMLENPRQFSAMVLAADYAWSGRREKPDALPYDPQEVFRQLFYGRPSPLSPKPGTLFGGAATFDIGGVRYHALDLKAASVLRPEDESGGQIELELNGAGRELNLAVATTVAAKIGDTVAEVRVERLGAPPIVQRLVYGRDLRALSDPEMLTKGDRTPGGPSGFRIELGKPGTKVTRVIVRPLDTYSGVQVLGATLLD